VTITTGTALAPDDDAYPDPEEGDTSQETDTVQEPGIDLVVVSEVASGISLTIAPDVVSHAPLAATPSPGNATPSATAPDAVGDGALAGSADVDAAEADSPLLAVIGLSTAETPPALPPRSIAERLRAALPFAGPGLTGLGGVVFGCLIVGLGAAVDLALGRGLGVIFTATFLLGSVLVACAVRTRALAVATVLPPLLFAGGYALETMTSGQTVGRREMLLDVATSLALHAPALFIGTAVAIAIVLVRLAVHLVRR
jgi:hypothetical protein